ncbi:hypothetical protein HDU96_008093 [Phlyctochytrium bullatum]|nr:hypothetical protein HDU96_008093 [Phlyctochytrium bullatum]
MTAVIPTRSMRLLLILLSMLLLLLATAVSAQSPSSITTFALVFEQNTLDEVKSSGYTNLGLIGCDNAVKELQSQGASSSSYACKAILRPLGSAAGEMGPVVSNAVFSAQISNTGLKNLQGVTFPEDEAGFLAGVAAGAVTNTSVVGVIGGNPVPAVRRYVHGFLSGVKYARPKAFVHGTFVADPTWANKDLGAAAADALLAHNADVIFAAGGAMGSAGLLRAARANCTVIGVDVDESQTTFRNFTAESTHLLTSALKNVDLATQLVLTEKAQNRFFAGNKRMDVTNSGIGLAPCTGSRVCGLLQKLFVLDDQASCSALQKPVADLLEEVQGRLRVGVITTGVSNGVLQNVGTQPNQTWTTVNAFGRHPGGLAGHTQTRVADTNTFLFFGGRNASGVLNPNLYLLDVDATNWTMLVPMSGPAPPGLEHHAAVYRRATRSLYIVGGTRDNGGFNADLWKFDIASRSWSVVAATNTPSPRAHHAVALVDDRWAYQWGGQDAGANVLNDLWKLDLDTAVWTRDQGIASNAGVPEASFSASMVVVNGTELVLFGGSTGAADLSTLWRFDTAVAAWRLETPAGAPPPRLSGHVGVVLDAQRVMYVGGTSGKVPQSAAWVYHAGMNEWREVKRWELPMGAGTAAAGMTGMTGVVFNQAKVPGACALEGSAYPVCEVVNKTMVLLYGGVQNGAGISGNLMAALSPDPPTFRFPQYIQASLLAIGHTASSLGILLSLIALLATVLFRRHPAFRSASPTFLAMYGIGALMAFVGVIFYNLPVTDGSGVVWCRVGVWVFSEGCMLLFSAMVVKNWRIHYIFLKSRSAQITVVKDGFLLLIVFILMCVNTTVLAVFTALSPFQLTTVLIDGDAWPICATSNLPLYLPLLLAPATLVLLYGLFISFSVRNVTSRFNESTHINLAIYVTVLSLVVLIPLILTIKLPPTLHVITSLMVCLTLYTVLGSNFGGKVWGAVSKTRGTRGGGDPGDDWGWSSDDHPTYAYDADNTLCCRTCRQPLRGSARAGQVQTGLAGESATERGTAKGEGKGKAVAVGSIGAGESGMAGPSAGRAVRGSSVGVKPLWINQYI